MVRASQGRIHSPVIALSRPSGPSKSQLFVSNNGSHLSNLAAYTNESTGNICVLWSTIQEVFKNISHLVDQNKQRVFYEVDVNYVL